MVTRSQGLSVLSQTLGRQLDCAGELYSYFQDAKDQNDKSQMLEVKQYICGPKNPHNLKDFKSNFHLR